LRTYEVKTNKRLNITVHALLTFVCQITLAGMSFYELFTNDQWVPNYKIQASTLILFARFICCTILHLSLIDEVDFGLVMMKYAVNHPYKFVKPHMAWLAGFMQAIATITIELASILVVCAAVDTIDIIFNFIALSILASFDNFVYESLKNESFKELISRPFTQETLKIKHTTSKKCQIHEVSDEIDEKGNARPLRVSFRLRTKGMKILFVIYKMIRTFFVSLYYYFFPFVCVIFSTLIPIYYREARNPPAPNPTPFNSYSY